MRSILSSCPKLCISSSHSHKKKCAVVSSTIDRKNTLLQVILFRVSSENTWSPYTSQTLIHHYTTMCTFGKKKLKEKTD